MRLINLFITCHNVKFLEGTFLKEVYIWNFPNYTDGITTFNYEIYMRKRSNIKQPFQEFSTKTSKQYRFYFNLTRNSLHSKFRVLRQALVNRFLVWLVLMNFIRNALKNYQLIQDLSNMRRNVRKGKAERKEKAAFI